MLGLFFKYGAYGDNYGSIFAIGDLSFCIAFSTGPIATSQLTEWVGFDHMLQIVGVLVSPFQCLWSVTVMLVTEFRCWSSFDVGDKNAQNRHQHMSSPTSMTNVDVTERDF